MESSEEEEQGISLRDTKPKIPKQPRKKASPKIKAQQGEAVAVAGIKRTHEEADDGEEEDDLAAQMTKRVNLGSMGAKRGGGGRGSNKPVSNATRGGPGAPGASRFSQAQRGAASAAQHKSRANPVHAEFNKMIEQQVKTMQSQGMSVVLAYDADGKAKVDQAPVAGVGDSMMDDLGACGSAGPPDDGLFTDKKHFAQMEKEKKAEERRASIAAKAEAKAKAKAEKEEVKVQKEEEKSKMKAGKDTERQKKAEERAQIKAAAEAKKVGPYIAKLGEEQSWRKIWKIFRVYSEMRGRFWYIDPKN